MTATATEVKPNRTSGRSRWRAAGNVRRTSKLDRKTRQTDCNNIFRWYRSGWGRYTQADPAGFGGGSNLYAYGDDDPIDAADRLGLAASKPCCVEVSSISPGKDLGGTGLSLWHIAGNDEGNVLQFNVDCPEDTPYLRAVNLESAGPPPWTPSRHPWPGGWDRRFYSVGKRNHYQINVTVPTRTWNLHHDDIFRVRVQLECCNTK